MTAIVSIITPAFNCEATILHTYHSLCNQTFHKWEWLVTDDCSSDDTYTILNNIALNDSRVKIRKNLVNSGAAVSRNASLDRAKGQFIAFIDSDDLWRPNKIEKQLDFMENSKVDFSFTAYELIDAQGNSLSQVVDTHHSKAINYQDMLRKKATIGCSTVMLRRDAFNEIQMPLLRTGQDYALWLKLLKTGIHAYPITCVLTEYRILPNSISRNKFKKAIRQWQIYREVERLPLILSVECFIFYAFRAVFRK
ncbi:glycosyltransferase family 2 protein [Vibrio sp. PID23_8]|uniref:glycosyltransferase family 2 protein n=1 Tax=Vibrio sp. PID23_8 TaxID=1583767 RepID=UPI000E67E9EB|nr:glycosyltransferase family 2 protein [Vibrio sp. PID23_8]RIZ54465.1 glycosyl transferase family 2 [Vibrio sp. PID23_8]